MNIDGNPLGTVTTANPNVESSEESSSSDEGTNVPDVPAVQSVSNPPSTNVNVSSSGRDPAGRDRKRKNKHRPEIPASNITVDAARELIKRSRKRSKPDGPAEPLLEVSKGKLTRHVHYGDERGRLLEYGRNLANHEFELASYVLESKWLPGQPKKGSLYAGKSFEFPSLFFGIEEKASNVLKSLAVLLGTNEEPKKATLFPGSHHAHMLIGAAICPDASQYYKDAVKAFGGDMMIRTLVKELYASNSRICAIVDCTHAQATSAGKEPDRLLDMIEQGYKPKSSGFKYANKPDFYDSD